MDSKILTPRERTILYLRFFGDYTLRETGEVTWSTCGHLLSAKGKYGPIYKGISCDRIRQIESKALRKLRQVADLKKITLKDLGRVLGEAVAVKIKAELGQKPKK